MRTTPTRVRVQRPRMWGEGQDWLRCFSRGTPSCLFVLVFLPALLVSIASPPLITCHPEWLSFSFTSPVYSSFRIILNRLSMITNIVSYQCLPLVMFPHIMPSSYHATFSFFSPPHSIRDRFVVLDKFRQVLVRNFKNEPIKVTTPPLAGKYAYVTYSWVIKQKGCHD